MLAVPLAAVPNQSLSTTLASQAAQINVYTLGYGAEAAVYFDLLNAGVPIVTCRPALTNVQLLQDARYQPFLGDFVFVDAQQTVEPDGNLDYENPVYSGLGSRWQLIYLSESDLG